MESTFISWLGWVSSWVGWCGCYCCTDTKTRSSLSTQEDVSTVYFQDIYTG